VVYLVHPRTQPAPDKLALLAAPLAAGCHCLIAINGPGRAPGLIGGGGGGRTPAAVPAAPEPYSSAAAGVCARSGGCMQCACWGHGGVTLKKHASELQLQHSVLNRERERDSYRVITVR
jgi:hypothetical protein